MAARKNNSVEAAVTLAASLAGVAALVWLGHGGWGRFVPNEQIAENRYFCEALRDGIIRQPANTWSNLGFIAVAVAIARAARGPALVRRIYVALVAFLGVGSMCLHASLTRWGGLVDVTSMILFIAFVAAHGIARLARLSPARLVALSLAVAALAETLYLIVPALGLPIFGTLIVVFAASEFVRPRPPRRWLAAAAVSFFVGFAIWLPSQNGRAWCAPRSLVQGHAAWHLLCAAAAAFLFLHFRAQSDD